MKRSQQIRYSDAMSISVDHPVMSGNILLSGPAVDTNDQVGKDINNTLPAGLSGRMLSDTVTEEQCCGPHQLHIYDAEIQ